jgi:FkbM family methyltransferase
MWRLRGLFDDIPVVDVLDVGAALGERPVYQSLAGAGAARNSGFEPVPAERDKLRARYGPPHRFYPDFVGDGRPHTFYETRWSLTGSLFGPNQALNATFQALAEAAALVRTRTVRTVRLDDVAGPDDVDFVKIDVQGAELMVFENALRVLSQAVLVQTAVEFVEPYREQPPIADVDRHLCVAGFLFHTFLGFGSRAFKPLLKKAQKEAGFRQLPWSDAV